MRGTNKTNVGDKMKYMGSKRRIAKHIIPIMVDSADEVGIIKWVEPFVGGANLIDKVPARFERVGYDLNEHVIYALKDIRDIPNDLPMQVSEEEYRGYKGRPAESITSWVRHVCAFGGRFGNVYARQGSSSKHRKPAALEGFNNAQKQSPLIKGVEFIHADYRDLSFSDSLIYCDPPYKGASGYKIGGFNHEEFYDWCREQAKNNIVFVSEYSAPEDFELVWQGEIKTRVANNRQKAAKNPVEKLFRVR